MGYCSMVENSCIERCAGEDKCENACRRARICCERDCPCHPNCLDGCPCPDWVDHGWCPDIITDDDCMEDWWYPEKICSNDCKNTAYKCLDSCYGNSFCVKDCHDKELKCLENCPCHKNCPNGCDHGWCPTWDQYCPATTPVTTTTTTTTTARTTTTTVSNGGGDGPTAPPLPDIEGDMILILADDKATLYQWPKKGAETFIKLKEGHQDPAKIWKDEGFWVHDSCSVQFKGESYLIGGSYYCDNGDKNCAHLNIQRAVMKLSRTKCGLDIVWDGYNKKLPFDFKEHSCAAYNRRIGNTGNNYQQHVMVCSPDDTANDPHNDKVYIDKFCWSTANMESNSMYWQREPNLQDKHIKGRMTQHNGRLVIIGGTGTKGNHDSTSDTNKVEWLNQNGIAYNNPEGTTGKWQYGTSYPIRTETHSLATIGDYLYVFGGLEYDESYDQFVDAAMFNTPKVYRNRDPSQNYKWERHSDLLRPRANHNTIYMGGQVFHIAGYAKDYTANPVVNNGRRVEKWEDIGKNSIKMETPKDVLYNRNSPQSFIVSSSFYSLCT